MDETIVTIVRTFIAFASLLLFARILGKQQVGELSAFEYITGITIGSIASTLSIDLAIKPLPIFVSLAVWTLLVFLMQILAIKLRWFAKVVDDQPTIVIQNGKILEKNLNKTRLRYDDLFSLLRQKAIFDITQVSYALLEPNGNLSVLAKPEYTPVTPKDMQLPYSQNGLMTEVIVDGVVFAENLKNRNKTSEWLQQQLQAKGVSDVKEVSIASILPDESLYIDKFIDSIEETEIGDFDGPF